MRNKKILLISIFIFMIVLSIGAVSADDADDAIASSDDETVLEDSESTISGTVSGGVDIVTVNPNPNTGNPDRFTGDLSYDIPKDAKTIKSADVYVNIYGVRTDDKYGANVNTTIKTANDEKFYNESLCYVNDDADHSIVHNVNDHVTKVYLNYMIHYDIKNLVSGLNGTKLTIHVDSFKMENKSFDGKIKLIALVLAYNNDTTDESISYWINDNQLWTQSDVNLTFNTEGKSGIATLTNVVLSSSDGAFKLNDKFLGDPKEHITGNSTFQYNQWDVSHLIDKNKNTTLNAANVGSSLRNALSVLTINEIKSNISAATEYSNNAYAGTNNTLKVTVSADKSGKYVVRLLADGVVVNETEVNLGDADVTLLLTDPTIRAVDESSVNGAENKKVNYTVELSWDGIVINSTSINPEIRYNGYLGKDLAYPAGGMEALDKIVINGDIVVDVKDEYLSGDNNLNKTDIWTINLDENSTIVKSFVYVPYNWCNPPSIEGLDMFNVTFNNAKATPVAFYRDQSNLGGASGGYGYGVVIYDVTSLVNKSGDNTLFVSKSARYPSVYSSALVYMYNTTSSNYIKEIYINNGADILYNSYNDAKRPVKSDSTFTIDSSLTSNAKLYVLASNAQNGTADLMFNGENNKNIFADGKQYKTSCYELDVTGKIKDANSVSVVGVGKTTFLALQQIMVLTKNLNDAEISLAPEYTSVPSAYAGTNNVLTVTINAIKSGNGTVKLYADGILVNSTEIYLASGENKVVLTDPTIRAVNETTVNGADNVKVNYTVELASGDISKNESFLLPVLYNGNLGKDLAYPAGGYESFLNIQINGDIVIDVKDVASYLGTAVMNREDVWTISLDSKSSIVKSYIYVPYNWFNPTLGSEGMSMFNTTFNGVEVTPVAFYRDQGNLGNYGKYGYGVLVYDVTNLTRTGENSFNLTKLAKTPAVYPSVLVYMYNTTGSAVVKNVYISNGADLLAGTSNNLAKRPVHADSIINVTDIADTAKLYIFAASAQADEGNIVFNGQTYENVWNGTSSTTDLYALDITASVKNANNISFVATGSTILALQQIIVVTKNAPVDTAITAPAVTVTYNSNAKNLVITLKDANGNVISDAKLTVNFNGKNTPLTTNAKGQAVLAISTKLVPKTYNAVITYDGDATHVKSTATAKVTVKKATVKLTAKKKTFKAKKKSKKYSVILKDNKGKAMKKVKLTLKVKGKTYKATTNAKGKATFNLKKLTKKGTHKAKITYKGDKYFNKLVKTVKIKVKK